MSSPVQPRARLALVSGGRPRALSAPLRHETAAVHTDHSRCAPVRCTVAWRGRAELLAELLSVSSAKRAADVLHDIELRAIHRVPRRLVRSWLSAMAQVLRTFPFVDAATFERHSKQLLLASYDVLAAASPPARPFTAGPARNGSRQLASAGIERLLAVRRRAAASNLTERLELQRRSRSPRRPRHDRIRWTTSGCLCTSTNGTTPHAR